MENEKTPAPAQSGLRQRTIAARFLLSVVVLAITFFLTAGTLGYWQAWVYMAIFFIPMGHSLRRALKTEPGFRERRLRRQRQERKQRPVLLLFSVIFLAAFLLPGLDRRWGWSRVPAWLSVAAGMLVLSACLLFLRVVRENPFLSPVIDVSPEQKVVASGPYAAVRHPMYAAVIPFYLFSPLALGSYWALIPAGLMPLIIVLRMFQEERLLSQELPGYRKYARRVKFRLIPGIW
jgi:protein-S-isoprenylcysteine O-methyltransferase Ste14